MLKALDVLPRGYLALFDSAVRAASADERIRALWLGGSLARGDADSASDLDLVVTVRDESRAQFAREWSTWLAKIAPTVIARLLPFLPGSFYALTATGERLDVVVESEAELAATPFRIHVAVFDRDHLIDRLPAAAPPEGPSREQIAFLIEEFLRIYGLGYVAVMRGDLLLMNEGIHLLRGLLYQLFCQANAPSSPAGMKRRSANLMPAQSATLGALPTGGRDWEETLRANEAVARALLANARQIAAEHGVQWPEALEATTLAVLRLHGFPQLAALHERAGESSR